MGNRISKIEAQIGEPGKREDWEGNEGEGIIAGKGYGRAGNELCQIEGRADGVHKPTRGKQETPRKMD